MDMMLNQESIQRIRIERGYHVIGLDLQSYSGCFGSLILDLLNWLMFRNSVVKMKVMIFL